MHLALLLHIYQPPTQFSEIFKVITEESYLKIIELLMAFPAAKVTLNIPAALTEQWGKHGFGRLITDLTDLARRGQVELTGSAAYHPLLFKLPEGEIARQIRLNEAINRRYFGDVWAPKGFFPPEMAVDGRVLRVIEKCGYEWVVLEQVQSSKFKVQSEAGQIFRRTGGKLKILFRDREASLGVAFGKIKTVEDLIKWEMKNGKWKILALDGETFGWHQPKQLELLRQFFAANSELNPPRADPNSEFRLLTVSELVDRLPNGPEIRVGKISWGERVEKGGEAYYPRWEDPDNEIHRMQWELTDLAIDSVRNSRYRVLVAVRRRD